MNYSDFRFTLDIQIHQAQVSVPVTFGDSARKLCIGLTDGRKPYVIGEGCIAVFNAKKPDGTKLKNACIIERNVILYEFTEQTANAEGIVYCDITLYGADGKVLTSPQFTIVVDKRVVRDTEVAVSEDQYTALDNIFTYEAQRQSQERQREENEELREILEKNRDDSEKQRKANEVSRLNAEGDRTVAEAKRVEAETQRDNTFKAKMTEWEEEFVNNSIVDVLSEATDKAPSVRLLNKNIENLKNGQFIVHAAYNAQTAESAAEATKAERDAHGTVIHENYTSKAEFSCYRQDIDEGRTRIVVKDANGNIPLDDDETAIQDRMFVAVSGAAVSYHLDDVLDNISRTYATKGEVGDINTALDSILAIQNSLIGGDA
jgi:hypothetical protein